MMCGEEFIMYIVEWPLLHVLCTDTLCKVIIQLSLTSEGVNNIEGI